MNERLEVKVTFRRAVHATSTHSRDDASTVVLDTTAVVSLEPSGGGPHSPVHTEPAHHTSQWLFYGNLALRHHVTLAYH